MFKNLVQKWEKRIEKKSYTPTSSNEIEKINKILPHKRVWSSSRKIWPKGKLEK